MADEPTTTRAKRDRRKRLPYTLTIGFHAPAEESAAVITKVLNSLQGVEVEAVHMDAPTPEPE